ncbi:hypothetical protein [Oceanotoga phage vB_OteS-UFV02]
MLDFSKIRFISVDKITGEEIQEFSNTAGITDSDNDTVDYMAEIPPLYFKTEMAEGKWQKRYSFDYKIGYTLHPTFIHNNKVCKRRIGAFEGYIDADNRLRSIPFVQPTTEKTIAQFRNAAKNRTTSSKNSFGLKTGYDYGLLGDLFALKYANLNSQATLSEGITNLDSGTGNHSQNAGHTLSLGSQMDGEVSITPENGATGASSTNPFRFLWIENLWGNVWEFLDGFFKTADGLYFGEENDLVNPSNMKEFYPREDVSAYKSGYVDKADKRIPWGIIPDVSFGGSSSTFLTDYMWYDVGERIARSGAYWAYGSPAGLLALNLTYDSSVSRWSLGARLAGFREV